MGAPSISSQGKGLEVMAGKTYLHHIARGGTKNICDALRKLCMQTIEPLIYDMYALKSLIISECFPFYK